MADPTAPLPRNEDSLAGFGFALGAYLLWGVLPLYMKALAHIPPVEVIAHRIIWSVPIAGALLIVTGRTADLRHAITTPRMLGMAAVTAALVSINWGIYVWSIGSGHALDAALGYYINPLFSIFLGAVLLRERLRHRPVGRDRAGRAGRRDPDGRGGAAAGRRAGIDGYLGRLCLPEEVAAHRPQSGLHAGGAAALARPRSTT